MGILAAEHCMNPNEFPLEFKRFEIVGHSHQVRLRRQPVGWMSPIPTGKEAELTALNQRLYPVLHALEIRRARLGPFGQGLSELGGFCRISLQRSGDIDPVECVQMVEVHDMVLDVLAGRNNIADEAGIVRDFDSKRVLNSADRSQGMYHGADRADPLRPEPDFSRIAIANNQFNAAKHCPGTPCVRDLAAIHLGFDPKVPLDPGDGIHYNASHRSLLGLRGSRFCLFLLNVSVVFLRANHAAHPVSRGERGHRANNAPADFFCGDVNAETGDLRQRLIERRHRVPESMRCAGNAAVPGFHRPTRPAIPPDRRAVVRCIRTFAAHLVKAPALATPFIAPFLDELTRVVVRPALTLIVDDLAIGEQRAVVLVERRHFVEG